MRIFINDKPLDILSYKKLGPKTRFSRVFTRDVKLDDVTDWTEDVLFEEPDETLVIKILYLLRTRKLKKLNSITLVSKDKKHLKEFIKSRFLIIKAAGGVVQRGEDCLLIHRFGKWDFPKGKFEKAETPEQCAVREVEEECAIVARANDHLCNTWHTYTKDRKSILKKTYWFTMTCLSDAGMKPQKEEGIEDIRWFDKKAAHKALKTSYPSMRYLFQRSLEEKYA